MRKVIPLNKFLFLLCIVPFLLQTSFAQTPEWRQGKVTYVTSQNIYTEFSNTEGISAGDTLFSRNGSIYTPAVIVQFISTRSVAGPSLSGSRITAGDLLFAKVLVDVVADTTTAEPDTTVKTEQEAGVIKTKPPVQDVKITRSVLKGRAAVQSSTTLVNTGTADDQQRWRYTLSLTSQDAYIQGLTLGTHLNYAYSVKEWQRISNAPLNRLIPYDLYASYESEEYGRFTAGRKISKWYPSLGAIDGVQFESGSDALRYGAFAGARPSAMQYGFDFKLFQGGVFVSRSDTIGKGTMENTISFIHQTNSFNTDRQFVSLLHYSQFFRWLSFFASAEADFYRQVPGQSGGTPELTTLYIQARMRITKELQAGVSYDARRNPVYYFTFRNLIDSSFSNPLREGTRIQLNYRPLPYLTMNATAGFRFRQGDGKTSVNFSVYGGLSKLPFVRGSMVYSFARSEASYSVSDNHSLLYRDEVGQDISWSAGVRMYSYSYGSGRLKLRQNMIHSDLNWMFMEKTFLTLSIEETVSKSLTSGRIYLDLTRRF
ncbi:MAG: hypothetical protein HRU80_06680 [Ignavibacteriales bacterium]|nr:MAG: hypothetical protein HRU80_06680 [Ignavibacteriales bacterium]